MAERVAKVGVNKEMTMELPAQLNTPKTTTLIVSPTM